MNDVSDYYAMYVGIMRISEDVFWNCSIGFVKDSAANMTAYNKWINRQRELREKKKRKR